MLTIWPLLVPLLGASPALATTIDRVVVVVDDQLMLASDVRIEEAMGQLDVSPSPFWAHDRAPAEQRLVEAGVIRVLAADVSLYQPSESAVRARAEAVLQRAPGTAGAREAFLADLGLADDRGLAAVVRRRMVVERYLARNIQETGPAWSGAFSSLIDRLRGRTRIREIQEAT
ncbi:MAG: hypothetical protein ACI9K2_004720 [Myxococcota bacterium]